MGPAKKPEVSERLRSRRDERFQLRLRKEVDQIYGAMIEKFTNALVLADEPDGYEIKRLSNQLEPLCTLRYANIQTVLCLTI